MKTRSGRSSMSGIAQDPDYRRAPKNTPPETMEGWVSEYLLGSEPHRNLLISAHYHLVAGIARNLARRYNRWQIVDELVSEALFQLVEAVDAAKEALHDNQITPYVTTTVRHRLRDFIARDRCVFMPGRTFRKKAADGELVEGSLSRAVIGVISVNALIEEDMSREDDSVNEIRFAASHINFHVPEAPSDDVSPEFEEALTLAIHSDEERRLIDMRIEGYRYRDMEDILGLKRSNVCNILNRVKRRFERHYA